LYSLSTKRNKQLTVKNGGDMLRGRCKIKIFNFNFNGNDKIIDATLSPIR